MSLAHFNSAAFSTASGLAVSADAIVSVRRESDGALASIFSDRAGTAGISQPGFVADSSGRFDFFCAWIDQGYQVTVTDVGSPGGSHTLNNVLDLGPVAAQLAAADTVLAARQLLGTMGLSGTTDRATNTILAAADDGGRFVATGSFTQTLTAAATLGADWHVHYRVNSGQTVTFDPNAAELIDGAATKVIVGPAAGYIVCDGSVFHTFGFFQGTDVQDASDTAKGIIEIATQAEQETGTDATRAVTPGRQRFHPTAAKAWVRFNGTGVVAINGSYNVTSITDNGTGSYTVNFTNAMSDANYCAVAGNGLPANPGSTEIGGVTQTTTALNVICVGVVSIGGDNRTLQDRNKVFVVVFGDQ